MPYVEYCCTITFLSKPDPDDPASLEEQADGQMEGLDWWLMDIGAHLEVLNRHSSTEGADDGDAT